MYTILENAKIVIALLKKHNIRQIVLSPGGSNIPIVQGVQDDPFFECYSVVDERSAIYFAIGLYLKTGEPVATSCTTANATRNYIPGLTEAFYKHAPILAITMSKHPMYLAQDYMQCPIQTSLPIDCVKRSYSLPRINDDNDRTQCIRTANEAMLELTHHGKGPVQLNIEELDSETWRFSKDIELPDVRCIKRYTYPEEWKLDIGDKKVMILIGEHMPFSEREKLAIELFSKAFNVLIYANNIANFHGKYSVNANLLLSGMSQKYFNENLKPDILITIGGITGDYSIYNMLFNAPEGSFEHWRVSVDGNVVDTYKKLTKIFECEEVHFFEKMAADRKSFHEYYKLWKEFIDGLNYDVDIPFSNAYAAQQLFRRIPDNSYMNFAILNSLRSWLWFPIKSSVKCFSNVASFGIDGCLSTFLGESVATNDLCFHITGDLSFFYDMNAIGIRHIKNNVRILLVNNNGGVEFKLGNLQYQTEVGKYIAADGHFKNAKGWVETQGFKYMSASSKEEFLNYIEEFLGYSNEPIVFEIFTDPGDERKANGDLIRENAIGDREEEMKNHIKATAKKILGSENIDKIRTLLKK